METGLAPSEPLQEPRPEGYNGRREEKGGRSHARAVFVER